MNPAREEMLRRIRNGLGPTADSKAGPIPETARIAPRAPGDADAELDLFLSEVEKLGGKTRRLQNEAELSSALGELVEAEAVKKATLWQTQELKELFAEETLRGAGVEIVSPYEPYRHVAECELGVTTADFALPETGTLVLRSDAERPRVVSLLPRVHLALLRPSILRADLHQVLNVLKQDGYFVFITGPSRTSDIELTTTIGVHGPKTLYVWVLS